MVLEAELSDRAGESWVVRHRRLLATIGIALLTPYRDGSFAIAVIRRREPAARPGAAPATAYPHVDLLPRQCRCADA
jgi:hypothetical protein